MPLISRLTHFCLLRPTLAGALIAIATLALGIGLFQIQRETTARTFLGEDHRVVSEFDEHIDRFGGSYFVVIAFSCRDTTLCDSVFDPNALQMTEDIAIKLEGEYGIRSVHAPSHSSLLIPKNGDLEVRKFVELGKVAPDRDLLAERALRDPLWQRTLISEDGQVGAIVLDVVSTASELQQSLQVALEEALAPHQEAGWEFHLVGELIDFSYSGVYLERESNRMIPFLFGCLVLVLLVFLRSPLLVATTVATMGAAFLWTQGAMGWSGLKLNAVTSVTPSLVLAIGILDGVHLVTKFMEKTRGIKDLCRSRRRGFLVTSVSEIGTACLLTSLTTIAAFLAWCISGVAAFAEFGVSAAFGIFSAFLLTFTLLPLLLMHLPESALRDRGVSDSWDALLASILSFVSRRSRMILVTTVLATVLATVGLSRLRIEIHPEQLVGSKNKVTEWGRWVSKNLRATETVELAFFLPEGSSFKEPETLSLLHDIGVNIERDIVGVHHPRSVYDTLSWLHRLINDDDPGLEHPASTRDKNSQLALFLTLQDPIALDQWVSSREQADGRTKEVLRISFEADSDLPTPVQQRVVSNIGTYLDEKLPDDWKYTITGSIPLYLKMMHDLQAYQIRCFLLAAGTVFLVMIPFLGSVRYAVLAMIPSIIPVMTTLGFLGLWGFGLNPGSSMVGAIIIGIAVDDSIHLLTSYRRFLEKGAWPAEATAAAVREVGIPVIVSSLVLSAGFFSLAFSPFSSVSSFGVLSAIAILSALVGDLFILPALLRSPKIGAWLLRGKENAR